MSSIFPKKYQKIIDELPEFREQAEAASKDELNQIIILAQGNISNIEKDLEENQEIIDQREKLKQMVGPYKDAVRVQTAKTKWCLHLLKEKGVEIGGKTE
jgi:hypothetical protein